MDFQAFISLMKPFVSLMKESFTMNHAFMALANVFISFSDA